MTDSSQEQEIRMAIAQIWKGARPRTIQRVHDLEAAIQALQQQQDAMIRHDACQQAHKLSGALGTFGIAEGSQLASQMEALLQPGEGLDPAKLHNLNQWITELRHLIEQD